MDLKNLIAISGLSGIYKIVANKNSGLIVADLDTGKTQFCSVRNHQFTPLETIGIYVDGGTKELSEVFSIMHAQAKTTPVPSPSEAQHVLKEYLATILPEYDRDRVYHSDIKKLIKWYTFLQNRNYMSTEITTHSDHNEEE